MNDEVCPPCRILFDGHFNLFPHAIYLTFQFLIPNLCKNLTCQLCHFSYFKQAKTKCVRCVLSVARPRETSTLPPQTDSNGTRDREAGGPVAASRDTNRKTRGLQGAEATPALSHACNGNERISTAEGQLHCGRTQRKRLAQT